MRDKSNRKMKSSTERSDLDRQNQCTRRARSSSATPHDGDLIDLSNDKNQNTMESTREGVEDFSSDETPASKEKSSLVTQAWRAIGLSPMVRGSPQKPHSTNIDQQINTRRKLEEDCVALKKTCEALQEDSKVAVSENKQLRSELKNAEDQHENTKARARSIIKSLKSDLEIANEQISDLRSEVATANEKFQTAEIVAVEDASRLTSYIDAVKQEFFEEKQSALQEIQRLRSQIEVLNEKNDKFRQMLIPVSEKQVLDAAVVQKFASLRSSIMKLVRRTWTLKFKHDVDISLLPKGQQDFFQSSIPLSYDRLRFAVFAFVYHGIFDSKNYFLQDGFENFEEYLQKVEKSLIRNSPVENRALVMEWRNASFKVTETFRGDGHHLSRVIQSRILNFLGPLQMVDNLAVEAKGNKLEEVCDAAIDLSLTIRQLKDNFWVDNMVNTLDQPISQWDTFTEELATVPAGDGKQPGTIAYVIAGALIKNPKESLEKVLVLEKAEVAVYR